MVIILQLQGNRDLSKLFWFQPTIQQWTITLNASITQCLFGKLITTTSFAIDKSAWNQQSTVTDWNQRFDQNHKSKELTEVMESLKESWGGWGKVGSFMDWQTKKIEIKGLIKNSSGCQWDKVYDSKEEEKQHNLTEAQHSQTSHCRTQQCHHLTCFMISTNFIQQETS